MNDAVTMSVGVVGFSQNQFDHKMAEQIIRTYYEKLVSEHSDKTIEIVSGYTNTGVVKIAYELADEFGFVTVGFSAKQALTVRAGLYPVQKVILRGEKFGDESSDFVRYINRLLRVGGGKQSRAETQLFKEIQSGRDLSIILEEHEVEWYGQY